MRDMRLWPHDNLQRRTVARGRHQLATGVKLTAAFCDYLTTLSWIMSPQPSVAVSVDSAQVSQTSSLVALLHGQTSPMFDDLVEGDDVASGGRNSDLKCHRNV